MSWIRSNIRFGSWLALTALALQIVLAFGHVHFDGVRSASAAEIVAGTKAPLPPPQPTQHPGGDAYDYCAICAAIHLAANSLVPQAPQVVVFVASQQIEHFNQSAGVLAVPRRAPFQSRAPPLA